MIFWDVNLWVHAFRKDSPFHKKAKQELEIALHEGSQFLFSPYASASFLRLVTNPKIFVQPSRYEEAWEFIDFLANHPLAYFGDVDRISFGIFKHICLVNELAGNEVPDAVFAALAIRYDSVFVTADRGFSVYKGLRLKLI